MDNYLDRIRDTFPEAIDSYKVIDSGWTNLVIEINDQWIWRFARDRSNPQTALEGAFLPAFSDVSPLPIPTPVWQGEDFIAYKKIKGERCAPEKFFQLGSDQQSDMISGIGAFLTALHSFEFTHLKLSEAPYGGGDFWVDLWPSVEGKLSDRARSNAERFFKNAFNAIDAYPFSKTLIHSDLATNNLLVNFEAPRLTGIIDFGDLSIGDPAADFAGFYRRFGRQFVEKLLKAYERPLEKNVWARIEFEAWRKQVFVVYYAQNYGHAHYIPHILREIEKQFGE